MMAKVYLGFGSNLGERANYIQKALESLREHPGIVVRKVSSLYESEPVEMESQNRFLNGVAEVETRLTPPKMMNYLEEIEQKLGRDRAGKDQRLDRTIDLDILFYNDWVFSISGLAVPHPWAHKRKFVLVPLLEIAPQFEHPYLRVPLAQILENLNTDEKLEACPHLTLSP